VIIKIQPSVISGSLYAPASKSSMQRACAAALLKEGETIINNPGISNDDLAALSVIQNLGAIVKHSEDDLIISSNGVQPISKEINCGESGLGLRMFAPIAALSTSEIILNGTGSLLQRPMDFFDEIFPLLNINVQSNDGKLPVIIKGPLRPANITIEGSLSSQFLTGLVMAYAKACTEPVTIFVKNLKSKPYIDLTLKVIEDFGWDVSHFNYEEFYFKPAEKHNSSITYTVEGDWSGAAFLLVAGAIAGEIVVEGLDVNSTQADKAIIVALENAGANISYTNNQFTVSAIDLTAFNFEANDCPDLFPPLVALASYCKGISKIKGVGRLMHKESNRSASLQQEFKKMGVEINLDGDEMFITGNGNIQGAEVESHHDHRIAMACAVAALKATGETTINNAEAVNKSYPEFYDHLQKLNATLQKL